MAKFNDIRELAQQNARWVSNSPKDWMNYLDVAARLYRYSFKDTLLIHAQRPDATACAELEVWNKKMNRWVNRGAKGIALLDDASPRAKLRYVFDIADTHLVQGGRTPILWRIDDSEHQQMILDHLADTYALTQTDSMNAALMELAQQLTAENLEEAMDGLEYEVADTFLEGLDEDNLRVRFRELMTNSIFYTLSRRCEQEPLEVLEDEDFIRIVDFNQLPVLTFLGNAVSEQCEAVLRDIGREMQKIYRKEVTEHLAKTADSLYNTSTDFNALKRETETNITEGGKPYGTDLSPQGGLPVSEPDRTGRADEHWEVRDAAQDLSEGKQEELVSEYADERQAESASGADRRAGGEPDGRTDREPEREVSGSEQGNRTDGMGGTSEQSDRDGGRNRAEGIGVQLTADTTEQDLSEAEEEIASAFSLPSLPTVEQQIRAIEAPMQAQYADEITIPAEVVDEILRTGSNRSKSQLRLIYNFMTEQTPEEYTAFVKKEYGEGGKGFEIGGTKYAVWFDELGMQIAVGDTIRNDPKNKAFLSWEDVSCRIHQLLQQGEYAPKSVLDAARGNALHEHAEALSYMERDMAEGVAEMVFADTSIFSGGYPELTERLAKLLDQPEFLADLNERLLGLAEAYAEDKSVMRMQFYRPDKVSERFQKFALPYQPYQAREGFQWNEQEVFITEDEINAFLAGGGPYSDGRLATYSFFLTHTEKAERAAFLKDRYGVGGSSHALSRADNSHASYDGRGLELARGIYGKPDALVKLNWNQAAERVAKLIDQSLYLKPADYSRMPSYEREQMVNRVIGFYHRLPDEVERPFKRELLNEDARKKLPTMLADPEQAVELLEKMDAALLSVPLDSPEYAEKSKTLAELHQYVEGTYTIFPEKKKAVEISVSETGQISLFDIWAQEQESKEHSTTAVVEEPQKQAAKYSRNVGDYLYLEDDRLYKIERVTDSLIYLKDMERPAWAARVLRPNQYDAELAKNPLNDYLLAGQKSALKDSRCVYKECLYSMLDAVQQSEIYPYLRDRDVDADEAEKELRNKIDELLEQNAKTAPLYLEASQNWENFKDWLVEDIFQHTYQDVITDRRDAVALYQDSKDAPQWVRGIMVPYAAEEKAVEPTLQPLPLDAVNEYNALKERYPDALVGYEQYGNFEFYGEDAKRVSELLGSKLLEKETALGKVEVSGFPREQWVSQAMKLWKQGESVYLSGQQEDGTHAQTKYFRREEYLPVNTIIELDDREFRVDSVNFEQGTVSLQDMTLAKEARYPIFRTEPLEYIRHLYEQADVPMEEAVEITVFTALHNAGVAYEDFSPEQMDVIYSVAESGGELEELLNPDFSPEQMQLIADVQTRTDAIHRSAVDDVLNPLTSKPMTPEEVNHARRQHNLPLDSGAETEQPAQPKQEPMNFRITDDDLGAGGAKTKFKANIEAIRLLQTLDAEQRQATAEEQEVLSQYVGWGGIPQAFDEKNADWSKEYAELKSLLPADEYSEARASTLNAFYTSPTVIKAMYEALSNMGLSKGNVLEPSCGVGNFMGLVPESMENIKMYGVELDNVSGRIAQQLYQKNKIAVQGFETMQFPDSFFDCVVGNVPFGNYKVPDKRYDRHNFLIHDYFIAKSLDLVRPGGVVAVVTSSGTMDKKDSSVREYLANRADLVGAIRLPNNAFQRNANTSVVADILFLQKRDRAAVERAEWVDLGTTPEGYPINQYFAQHPEMVLGEITTESTQYGKQETTVKPIEGADLAQQLKAAVENIHAEITEPEITDDELDQNAEPLPADPNVKNFSYTNVDGQVYYRENSYMNKVDLPAVTAERVLGMIALRETTQKLLDCQLHDGTDAEVELLQGKLKDQYKRFTAQYGLINSTANKRAFRQDSSYCLLASLEILDEDKNLKRLADIFTKRTIRKPEPVTSVDTPSEALALSIGEKAKVDVPFMAELCGKTEQEVTEELAGVIFRNPVTQAWVTADEYLSGNVREKLATAETFAANHPEYQVNVEYLKRVQPKDLNASEIEVRLGANWIKAEYITDFMEWVFKTPSYYIGSSIKATYSEISGAWNISGKSLDRSNPRVTNTYGTMRVNGYRLLEDALNLRDTKIYDTIYTIMRYLQYDTLQKLHLGHFDSWAASFGETVTAIELSPEGTGYRAKTRFARFFNLPELISLFKESADVQTADMLNLPVPEAEYINEVLKPSETQQEMVSSFADRAERVRNGNVDPRTDNMLKITNDGRKLALDQRLINDLLPDEPESKVNLCVENAYQVWEESTPDKSTQLIFCDLSTPKADGTFNVYDDVREKLVAKGIPREEIAFIHEANTETKKAELFAKVRSGQVRILLGSTPKLGAGTNIQDRLIALHHLDCPWKPSDLEQQEGRILRQGNRNQKVKIFRYVTENTFDSYMWQILENKQKFISQIMTSKSPVRACDDVDDTALTYAEIKALATGNPYIKEKMDLDIQVSKLKLMRANHTSQIYSLESDIARRYPAEITAAKERMAGLKADLAVAKPLLEQDKEKFSITVEDRVYTDRKEAGSAILAACAAMKIAKTEGQIADLGGFAISSRFDAFAQTFKLTIKRQSSYTIELGSDPAGNIQRILNALASIEKTLPQVERRLETLQQQLAEAKEEVQRPFPQETELNEKSARLAELNALLDMDEKGDDAALGMDEEVTDSELPAPKREIERSADSVKRPSILAQLHEKQAERMAEPKPQKKKSHDMEL